MKGNNRAFRKNDRFNDLKGQIFLDEYGFPEMAVANRVLVNEDGYGESREQLEQGWEKWMHYLPFDAPVAEALARLYERRLGKIDKAKDPGMYQRLQRKLTLVRSRAARYSIDSFSPKE